jgi:hypothetical protein
MPFVQEPSVEMLSVDVEAGPVDVLLPVEVAVFVDEDPEGTALPALLYQLLSGSPRQVPTETDWKPLAYIEARI